MIQLIEPNFEEKVIYLILVHVNIENPTLDKKKNINNYQNFLKNLK